jgi:hypothetical protein
MISTVGEQPVERTIKRSRLGENRILIITLSAGLLGLALIQLATQASGLGGIFAPVMIAGALGLLVLSLSKWQLGAQSLLIILIVEGAVRKWFLPSASEMVYFYKDALMIAILIGYFRQSRKAPFLIKGRVSLFFAMSCIFALYGVAAVSEFSLMYMASSDNPHPLIGLLGLKAYCLYIPLAFIIPRMFSDKEKLIRFLKWYLLIVLPVAALSAMQFLNTDHSSAINKYAWESADGPSDIAVFYDSSGAYYVRVTGPFSFVSGLTTYLPTMFALLLGLISLQRKEISSRWKLLYYASVAGAVIVTFMSGSRAPVVILIIIALVFYSFTSIKYLFSRLAQIAILGSLVFAGTYFMFPQAFDAFYERAFGEEERINEGLERMVEPFRIPTEEAYYAGAFGFGIGTTQNSVSVLMAMFNPGHSGSLTPIPSEGEQGRIMLELGVIGFLIYTLFRLVLILTVLQICFSIRDPESRILAFAILGALISPLLFGGAIVSHTQNVYQWFLVGALLALANAERIAFHQNHPEETAARALAAR